MTRLFKKISGFVYVGLNRNRILLAVRSDFKSAWPLIENVWGRAVGLYRSRIGASARKPFELVILEEVVAAGSDCEKFLEDNLLHDSPYVAAYCLLGLEHLSSKKIRNLPSELLNRRDVIEICTGSYILSQTLGEFAKQVSNRAS